MGTLGPMLEGEAKKVLVVDDEPRLRRVLVRLLDGEGFACREAGSGVEAIAVLEQESFPLVISDIRMPQMDGVTLLKEITRRWPETGVVVVTAVAEVESAVACLQLGALDYVAKPFHLDEVRARVQQALDKRRLILENKNYQLHLEERVEVQARKIEELFLGSAQALVHALEAKDAYLRGHSLRVAEYAVGVARELHLAEGAVDAIALGSHLHDIGKIGVSEEVLHKEGKLTESEYRHIMEHPVIGARILGPLFRGKSVEIAIVRSHHERIDGKGLPDGLRGDAIPTEARIVSVADAFDAMTSVRPYRPSLGVDRALQELRDNKAVQFDPEAVEAFLRAFSREVVTLPIPTPEYRPVKLRARAEEAGRV
jgi:putative two-component system response regulator